MTYSLFGSGTDYQTIQNAVDAVTEIENESTEFNAKLLQDTLKTDEYKQALEKEQGQSQAQQNTK